LKKFKPYFRENQVISFESTSYPGTTEEIFEKFILDNKRTLGVDSFLIYSPEREDPGNKKFPIRKITKIVSAKTKNCLAIGNVLYKQICKKIYLIQNFKVAEMAKLLENSYRAIKIGFINELKKIATGFNIDIFEVVKAASTKPFGFEAFYPGPGVGGHCIPVDPLYLGWKAKKLGFKSLSIKELESEFLNEKNTYNKLYR
jgi:UDP-N-acetyl-D-glucosamine dehydrogenase